MEDIRSVKETPHNPESLQQIYKAQFEWFKAQRSELYRKARLISRKHVLDLGAGSGEVMRELSRRTDGEVTGVDRDPDILRLAEGKTLVANACDLPFPDAAFDLVVTQMFFLWAVPLGKVLSEIHRVLEPDGMLIAVAEPDYGGAIDSPKGSSGIAEFVARLRNEGADVEIARRMPKMLADAGFVVESGIHQTDPIAAAKPDSSLYSSPAMWRPAKTDFLLVPYFWFLARKNI